MNARASFTAKGNLKAVFLDDLDGQDIDFTPGLGAMLLVNATVRWSRKVDRDTEITLVFALPSGRDSLTVKFDAWSEAGDLAEFGEPIWSAVPTDAGWLTEWQEEPGHGCLKQADTAVYAILYYCLNPMLRSFQLDADKRRAHIADGLLFADIQS